MLHLSPPCRFFTPHWKLLDTMWGVLLHGTYSTRPLASTVKVLPLTLLLTYRPQFLIMQPAPHEQLCPAVLLSIELNFTETNFNLKAGEAWGNQKPAKRTRHSLPALLLFEGTVLSCALRNRMASSRLQLCIHCPWALHFCIMCTDFRHQVTANGPLTSPCNTMALG